MWITRVSIANPVFAVMVMVALCVLGMFAYVSSPGYFGKALKFALAPADSVSRTVAVGQAGCPAWRACGVSGWVGRLAAIAKKGF